MREERSSSGSRRGLRLVALALVLAGCGMPTHYAGIPLARGKADPDLQLLAWRGLADDNAAQLELGIRFEEGNGVPVDLARARNLYRLAGNASGGSVNVCTPAGRDGVNCALVDLGPPPPGLPEARRRYRALAEGATCSRADGPCSDEREAEPPAD